MALARKKTTDGEVAPDNPIERIFKSIEKNYGDGIFVTGREASDKKKKIISLSPCLDMNIGGGIEEGSWLGITGNPATCKTSLALSFAAECQKPENDSRPVFYAKVEGRLPLGVLEGTQGLLLDEPNFYVIQSSAQRILSAQNYLEIFLEIIKHVPRAVIIIDSISALCEERELNEGIGTETRGGGAKVFSSFCRQASNIVPVQNSIVIGITHLISNTSGMGAQYVERAARHWIYQCDYQLRSAIRTAWKVGEKQIGMEIQWTCNKTRRGHIGSSPKSFFRWGIGIDRIYEMMTLATAVGLIRMSGSWAYFEFLKKSPEDEKENVITAQGAEKAYKLLKEHPEWVELLRAKLMEMGDISLE